MKHRAVIYNRFDRTKRIDREAVLYARVGVTVRAETNARQLRVCSKWTKRCLCTESMQFSEIGAGEFAAQPQLSAGLDYAVEHGAVVICPRPDRLSRDKRELSRILANCAQRGVAIRFVQGGGHAVGSG